MKPCRSPSGGTMHVRTRVRGVMLTMTACVCSRDVDARWCERGCFRGESQRHRPRPVAAGCRSPGFTSFDPAVVGYEQSEVFLSGTASAYEPAAPLGADGKYSVAATSTAPVHDPRRRDATDQSAPLQRNGRRGVVERQRRRRRGPGLDAGAQRTDTRRIRLGRRLRAESRRRRLKSADPPRGDAGRYANLSHPGDSYSYDIFSQAGQAIRDNAAHDARRLTPKQIIAAGESQSAGRLVTYIDAVHPLVTSTTASSCTAAGAERGVVAFPELAAEGRLRAFTYEGEWLTVNTPEYLERAEEHLRAHPALRRLAAAYCEGSRSGGSSVSGSLASADFDARPMPSS